MREFSMQAFGYYATISMQLRRIIMKPNMMFLMVHHDTSTVFTFGFVPCYPFIAALIVVLLAEIHLILAMCGESKIVLLIIQSFIFVFMVNLHLKWSFHNGAVHKKRSPFAVYENLPRGVEMAASPFDRVPFVLGYLGIIGLIYESDQSFGEKNFSGHNSL